MNQSYIQFKKQRELGDILSDTFKFFRENFKPLFKIIFKTAGPIFILLALSLGFYTYWTADLTSPGMFRFEGLEENLLYIGIAYLFLIVSMFAYFGMLYSSILNYIKNYIQNNGTIQEEAIIDATKKDFGALFGLNFLVAIMVFFGLMLCVIPGIYIMVPLSLSFSLVVFDRMSVSDSISESFTLIKDNWWITFATILVMLILIGVIGFVLNIPVIIYSMVKVITMSQEGSTADPSQLVDWVYITLNIISTIIQYLLYSLMAITTAFIYFDLKERKYFVGTYETIDSLGKENQ